MAEAAKRNFAQELLAIRDSSVRRTQDGGAPFWSAVASSTLSGRGLSRLVAAHYGIETLVKCTLIQRGVNDTYLLSTATRNFALKVYRVRWRSRDSIMEELTSIQHIGTKGVQVATPITRSDGGLITDIEAPEGVRSAVLFCWSEGRTPKYAEAAHSRSAGILLGELHAAGAECTTLRVRPRKDIKELFERPSACIRARVSGSPALAGRLNAIASRIEARADEVRRRLEDWGFCHGDFTESNMRVDGDAARVFDFDWCGAGWRVFDMATFKWAARRQGLDQTAWQPFIDGYLSVRPTAARSLQFVPLFVVLRHFWHTAQCIALSSYLGAGFLSDEFFEDFVVFCEKIDWEASLR
jgi:Ser/Thr protein kinase RdoA (MazF antagonist)